MMCLGTNETVCVKEVTSRTMTDGVKAGVKDESFAHLTRSESLSSSFLKYPIEETHILAFKIENSTKTFNMKWSLLQVYLRLRVVTIH